MINSIKTNNENNAVYPYIEELRQQLRIMLIAPAIFVKNLLEATLAEITNKQLIELHENKEVFIPIASPDLVAYLNATDQSDAVTISMVLDELSCWSGFGLDLYASNEDAKSTNQISYVLCVWQDDDDDFIELPEETIEEIVTAPPLVMRAAA